MPKNSTTLKALTVVLALGLFTVPATAQAGHKSDNYSKNGNYEWKSGNKHEGKWEKRSKRKSHDRRAERQARRDYDDGGRRGDHRAGKYAKGHDGHGHKHGRQRRQVEHFVGKHGHGHNHRYGHGRHDYRGNGFRAHHGGYFGRLQVSSHGHRGACHTVSKIGYRHGQKALIGGTACYDRYGNFYVLEGSRYIIRYLVGRY